MKEYDKSKAQLIKELETLQTQLASQDTMVDIRNREMSDFDQIRTNLGIELSRCSSINTALDIILNNLFELREFDSGSIYLVDKDTGDFSLEEHRGLSKTFVKRTSYYRSDSAQAEVLKAGEPTYLRVCDSPVEMNSAFKKEGLQSIAVIPIKHGTEIIGSLNLASHTHDAITESGKKVVEALTGCEIGLAISRIITEEELRRSEEKFTAFLNYYPGPAFIKDENLIVVYVNDYLKEHHGADKWIGKHPSQIFPAEIAEIIIRDDQIALDDGKGTFETQLVDKNGAVRHYLTNKFSITFPDRKPLLGDISSDITDREKTDERFRLITRSITDLIYEWDVLTDSLVWFGDLEEALGYEPGGIPRTIHGWAKLIHPDDRARLSDSVQRHRESVEPIIEEYRVQKKDGSYAIWSDMGTPILGKNGKPLKWIGGCEDITERKESERRIEHLNSVLHAVRNVNQLITKEKDRDNLLRGICENLVHTRGYTSAWIALLGKKNELIAFNERGLGRTREKLKKWLELGKMNECSRRAMIQNSIVKIENPVSECGDCPLLGIEPWNREMTMRLEHDRKVYGLLSVSIPANFLADEEEHLLFSDTAEDIAFALHNMEFAADRKRAEEELQKMEKLKSVGTLAGGIAHDFNNILMSIFGNISLAKEELPQSHSGFRYLEDAEKSLNRATHLTKQLLTFAKGGEPIRETISIAILIEEVVRFDLSGSNVMLAIDSPDDLRMADVDKGQIQQVFSNLAINADQSMPDGGNLHITLKNAEIPDDPIIDLDRGNYIKVTVQDEGTGIAREHLDRIFDPYFSTKQSGSGLGLATVYSIVNRHGGSITVDSKLGRGTTFTLFLPASESQYLPEHPETKRSIPEKTTRILVMDDDEMVRNVVVVMLERSGYSVITTCDGEQMIEIYKQAMNAGEAFNAVIMDLTIPGGKGGKEANKELLSIDPEARSIVSSGYTDDPVLANYTEYGFKGFVSKPFTRTELLNVLDQILK